MQPTNDNGGANVTALRIRKAPFRFASVIRRPRHVMPTNDRFGDAARVDLYDELLKDEWRYVEVAGKRHEVGSLRLILDRQSEPAMRTVYMLGDKGENIHQFELPDAKIMQAVYAYSAAPDTYTRRGIAVAISETMHNAAQEAGVNLPRAYAESMFRCCAEQLAPTQIQRSRSR